MKLIILGLALVTIACAEYTQYEAPLESFSEDFSPSVEYLPPAEHEATVLADDGYRYKTVRRLRHRIRRDVNELPTAEYLPPQQELSTEHVEEASITSLPSFHDLSSGYGEVATSYLAPVEHEENILADDGYRYKTVRRLRHRQRRDVSELPSAGYLSPDQEISVEYHAEPTISQPIESHEEVVAEPSNSYLAPAEDQKTLLADDGYRYKTVRRLRHRHRRDVSELVNAEYLPPHEEVSTEYIQPAISSIESHQEAAVEYAAPSTSYIAPAEHQETILADDGYRYKTVRRLRHRNRRDVSELVNAEYLPPHQEVSAEPTNSYLAPHEETVVEYAAPTTSYLAPAEHEETILADDGYRYKTVKKFKIRRH